MINSSRIIQGRKKFKLMKRQTFIKLAGLTGISTLFGMKGLSALQKYSESLSNSPRMPVLFLGLGSPMNAIEENQFVKGFREIGKTIPKPNAIICISAHWYTRGTKVTAMEMPKTIHDFGGGLPPLLFGLSTVRL